MTTSKKKRKFLLVCAQKGFTLSQVNRQLESEGLGTVRAQQWSLWVNYLRDIIKNDPCFENELIENNRPLVWFTREINLRRSKNIIS